MMEWWETTCIDGVTRLKEGTADLAITCVKIVGPGRLVSGLVLGETRGYAQRGRRLGGDVVVRVRTLFFLVVLVDAT